MEAVSPARYDDGGILQPGMTLAVNNSGQPEPVLTPDETDGDES